jgi:hypothetical protein
LGQRGEMTQALYAHMNNKTIKIKKRKNFSFSLSSEVVIPASSLGTGI